MNSLPAKGAARVLSAAALVGCALSVLVQVIALLGFHSKAILNFQIGLTFGIFLLVLPVYLAQEKLLSELSYPFRFTMSRKMWKALSSRAPEWMLTLVRAVSLYALAVFIVFAWRNGLAKSTSELDEIWYISAFVAAAYSTFAAMLMSYARSEHPLRFGDFN